MDSNERKRNISDAYKEMAETYRKTNSTKCRKITKFNVCVRIVMCKRVERHEEEIFIHCNICDKALTFVHSEKNNH